MTSGIAIADVMDQAKALGLDMLAVPFGGAQASNEQYTAAVRAGLALLPTGEEGGSANSASAGEGAGAGAAAAAATAATAEAGPRRLVFGDLHLEDIRAWREASFPEHACLFPIFGVPYARLQAALWR
jgi:hypothetical protein